MTDRIDTLALSDRLCALTGRARCVCIAWHADADSWSAEVDEFFGYGDTPEAALRAAEALAFPPPRPDPRQTVIPGVEP